jgi:alkylation response protein AidB-like acyl-CoA dehydrogenase
MDFDDTAEEAAFRSEARRWLAANAPRWVWPPNPSNADRLRLSRGWMAAKADAGYAGITLPKELGGRGGTPIEDVIFREEERKWMSNSTDEAYALGAGMAIPTLRAHAQPGWLERLAKPTLRGDVLWCQLFSEPGAGSDIAGFRTRAVREGNDWIVNGQKIWTSGAHNADWGLLLTRTDPNVPKHKGLTYFLIDMHNPGVEVRPLMQISGRADFNEVFFTDVRIPDNQRLGEINGGWAVAMTTMMNERLTLSADMSVARNVIPPLMRIASRTDGISGNQVLAESSCREKIASYYVAAAGMQHIGARLRTALARGETPGPEATIGKVVLTRLLQEMSGYAMDLAGPAANVIDARADADLAEVQEAYFLAVGFRMGGGTEEIGKNIIAERILGLPQDVRPDKDVPFNKSPGFSR